jgi:lysine-specific demethylase 3
MNLTINMGDVVHMLMHAVEVRNQYPNRPPSNGSERIANGTSTHVNDHTPVPDLDLIVGEQEYKHAISHCEEAKANNLEGSQAGAVWDVFRRQDLPKLNEYLAAHREEFGANCQAVPSVKYPIYDQNVYLNNHHKKTLKDQYGIEPCTFYQHIGEAVFIPAGCPFQVKNLQVMHLTLISFLVLKVSSCYFHEK